MCRFALYLGGPPLGLDALLTRPVNSIIRQSFQNREREEPLNGDGFGLGWYDTEHTDPGLYREVRPAWSDENLRHLCRHIRSHLFFAHVRASTGTPIAAATPVRPPIDSRCASRIFSSVRASSMRAAAGSWGAMSPASSLRSSSATISRWIATRVSSSSTRRVAATHVNTWSRRRLYTSHATLPILSRAASDRCRAWSRR